MPNEEARIPGFDLPRLLEQEAQAVAQRRQQAFRSPGVRPPHYIESAPPRVLPLVGNPDGNGKAHAGEGHAEEPRWPLPGNLVGLALSGGGLRSAAYNLGFIQALSRFGLFRYVDYLASVSGGAYVGGHVTAASSSVEHFHDHPEAQFGVDANQRLDPAVYRFRHLGEYLLDYASFLWRYIVSTLATLLLFVSLLGVGACLVALIWRGHDMALVREYRNITGINQFAEQLGIGGETLSAFLPSFPLFLVYLWLALMRRIAFQNRIPQWLSDQGGPNPTFRASPVLFLIQHASLLLIGGALLATILPEPLLHIVQGSLNNPIILIVVVILGVILAYSAACVWLVVLRMFDGSVVHGALWVALASLVISLAVFMGNGLSGWMADTPEFDVQSKSSWFYALSAIFSLLPIVAAGQLARSGQHNAPRWKKRLFYVLVSAATVGLPMAFIHLAARENVSGIATHRGPELLAEDVYDWHAFLALLGETSHESQAPSTRPLAFLNVKERNNLRDKDKFQSSELCGAKLALVANEIQGQTQLERYRNSPAVRPLRGTGHFLGINAGVGESNVFAYLAQWNAVRDQRRKFLDELVNPALFSSGEGRTILSDTDPTTKLIELVALRGKKELKGVGAKPQDSKVDKTQPTGGAAANVKSTDSTVAEQTPPAKDGSTVSLDERRAVDAYVKERAAKMLEGGAFVGLWNRATLDGANLDADLAAAQREFALTATERAAFNRLLLEFLFPSVIRERQMVSTFIVPPHDQWYRAGWLALFAAAFLLSLTVDYNRWSPFYSYYRERLSQYFVSVFGDSWLRRPLHEYRTWEHGGPLPLILGSHFLFCRVRPEQRQAADGAAESGGTSAGQRRSPWFRDPAAASDASSVHPWVFSPLFCGGPAAGYQQTEHYCGQNLTLGDAMAISGSALTPFLVDNIFFCALMAAFNLRIGQWLPRPGYSSGKATLTARGYEIGWEIWQGCFNVDRYHKDWKLTLAADGGFHDFFGLEELLVRRCRTIVVSDAGCNNGPFEFGALADVIRMIRERHGIAILDLDNDCPADLSVLRREKLNNVQPMHHICLRIAYPPREGESEATYGLLVYAQMSLTGREPLDLQQFRNSHPDFPDEPITNQFFDSKQVESYRQLGYHVGSSVCSQLRPYVHEPAGRRFADVSDVGRELVLGYLAERIASTPKKEKEPDHLVPGGVDLFECRPLWCPEPPALAVEDYVSSQISAFFAHPHAVCPTVEQAQGKLAHPQEAELTVLLSRYAIQLLKVHRRLTGHPTKAPFLPGGRRVMIRALATAIVFREARAGNEPIHAFIEKQNPSPYAWCALANLVFRTAGVEAVARFLDEILPGREDLEPAGASHRLQSLIEALRKGDLAELSTLLRPPPPQAVSQLRGDDRADQSGRPAAEPAIVD